MKMKVYIDEYLLVEDVVGLMARVADSLAEGAEYGVSVGRERL